MQPTRSHPALVFAVIFLAIFLLHIPLLSLPYFWDEAGYYVPAARDLLLRRPPKMPLGDIESLVDEHEQLTETAREIVRSLSPKVPNLQKQCCDAIPVNIDFETSQSSDASVRCGDVRIAVHLELAGRAGIGADLRGRAAGPLDLSVGHKTLHSARAGAPLV